jgi:catechol 2,3-dioxygenase-like lactoylglutathione lyase family enzyme
MPAGPAPTITRSGVRTVPAGTVLALMNALSGRSAVEPVSLAPDHRRCNRGAVDESARNALTLDAGGDNMNLNHIHLHVANVARAKAFYERYFGMRELVWHGDMVFMRDPAGMDLALAPTDKMEPLPSWFHIGFRLDDHAAVKTLFDRLVHDGVPINERLKVEGDFSYFRCADPDGTQLEIYYEPDPA